MKFYDFPQGSEDWLQCRAGKITASRFRDARDRLKPAKGETMGKPSYKCVAYAAQVAVERIAGRPVDKVYQNWQMKEGQEQEPNARNAYDVETGHVVQEVGAIATDDDMFLYSPDGLIGDDGLLEIKTLLSPEVILRVVGNGDLSDYMDQCMGGLWLTGRKWIDLVLWAPALEPIGRALTIHHITRDEEAIEKLEDDLLAFAAMVAENKRLLTGASDEPPPAAKDDAPDTAAPVAAAVHELPAAQKREEALRVAGATGADPDTEIAAAPPAANVHPMPTRAPAAPASAPTLKLSDIQQYIAPYTITEAGLRELGVEPAGRQGAAKLYHQADLIRMLEAGIPRLQRVLDDLRAVLAQEAA